EKSAGPLFFPGTVGDPDKTVACLGPTMLLKIPKQGKVGIESTDKGANPLPQKIVIVGAVGGGATTAAQIRRQNKETEITLLDKGSHIAFSNCGMPYFIGDVVNQRKDLLVDADKFAEKYRVDVRTG